MLFVCSYVYHLKQHDKSNSKTLDGVFLLWSTLVGVLDFSGSKFMAIRFLGFSTTLAQTRRVTVHRWVNHRHRYPLKIFHLGCWGGICVNDDRCTPNCLVRISYVTTPQWCRCDINYILMYTVNLTRPINSIVKSITQLFFCVECLVE